MNMVLSEVLLSIHFFFSFCIFNASVANILRNDYLLITFLFIIEMLMSQYNF